MSRLLLAVVVPTLLAGCAPALRASTVASIAASRDLRCRVTDVARLDDWSFRARSACGETTYYRCSGTIHVDCHAHGSAAEVTGLFHPADALGHGPL